MLVDQSTPRKTEVKLHANMDPLGIYLFVFLAIFNMTRGDPSGILTDMEGEKEIDNTAIFSFSCDEKCNKTLVNKGPFKHRP